MESHEERIGVWRGRRFKRGAVEISVLLGENKPSDKVQKIANI